MLKPNVEPDDSKTESPLLQNQMTQNKESLKTWNQIAQNQSHQLQSQMVQNRATNCITRWFKNRAKITLEPDDSKVESPFLEPYDSNNRVIKWEPDDPKVESAIVELDDSKPEPPT